MEIRTGQSVKAWAEDGHITLGVVDRQGEYLTLVDLGISETHHLISYLEALLDFLSKGADEGKSDN